MLNRSENRILYRLKTVGPQSVESLGHYLDMSTVGTRQHLTHMSELGLVCYTDVKEKVGRPVRVWSISKKGHKQFPDTHSALTLDFMTSIKTVFGEEGLDRLILDREKQTLRKYMNALSKYRSIRGKVSQLAKLREQEGYMAEWYKDDNGNYMLLENHCPICAAAKECQGLCRSELSLFQNVLGENVNVSRVEYLLEGARRCAYRITQRPGYVNSTD